MQSAAAVVLMALLIFAAYTAAVTHMLFNGLDNPKNFPLGDLDFHLIYGSMGPPESSTKMASRSVFAGLMNVTNRQTHRRYSVSSNRPHLATSCDAA